jgi:hypothetical protein
LLYGFCGLKFYIRDPLFSVTYTLILYLTIFNKPTFHCSNAFVCLLVKLAPTMIDCLTLQMILAPFIFDGALSVLFCLFYFIISLTPFFCANSFTHIYMEYCNVRIKGTVHNLFQRHGRFSYVVSSLAFMWE